MFFRRICFAVCNSSILHPLFATKAFVLFRFEANFVLFKSSIEMFTTKLTSLQIIFSIDAPAILGNFLLFLQITTLLLNYLFKMESSNNNSTCSSGVSSTTTIASVNELVYLDKCKVCGKPASKKCGGCSLAFYCGPTHQQTDWSRHKSECKLYEIVLTQERSDEEGKREGVYNLVASKVIPADTIIISEYPLIAFEDSPRSRNGSEEDLQAILGISGASPVKCFGCDSTWLTSCSDKCTEDRNRCNKCGLPFCGPACGGSSFHSEGDCRILQEMGKKETRRGFEDMTKIAEDLRLLRIIHREKQKGTPVSFRKGGSVMWGRLMKQVKVMFWSSPGGSGKEEDDRIKTLFPLSIAAVKSGGGNSEAGVEVVRLMSKVLGEATLPVDPKNKRYAKFY